MKIKIAFIDRDGTIINEPRDTKQVNNLEQLIFLPQVISSLKTLQNAGFKLVVVSNQDGLSTSKNPIENYNLINQKIIEILQSEGIQIAKWLTCPHYESDYCNCRKPKIGLINNEKNINFDKQNSIMIGDRDSDIEFAENLGIKSFKITQNYGWSDIVKDATSRICKLNRKTKETDINLSLNLDGSGNYAINTGLKFLDHMIEQIARHASFDITLTCKGDLEVDEHHTIEDIALCLGQAYKEALGDKKGINRFASERFVPLDESISFVSLDISGRAFCKFDAKFDREYCGDLPTEMIPHFFQSFASCALVNLHIKIEGKNTHHKIESCFKAFAKCLADASKISTDGVISTKGVL